MNTSEFLQTVYAKEKGFEYAKKLYLERLAPDFSPFEFIDDSEMRLSALLAWLLDPQGSHGQGPRFLQLFLQKLSANWPPDACARAEVRTEICIEDGRVDVQVTSSEKNRCCIIENKPWAADQVGQLDRYFKHLDARSGDNGGLNPSDYPLVYITANGSPPSDVSLPLKQFEERVGRGQLHTWAFPGQLMEWVNECRAICRSDRVATFIGEFSRYIRGRFGGAEDVTMQDQLVNEIVSSPAMVVSAMQVVLAGNALREKLLLKLKTEIGNAAAGEGWKWEWTILEYSRYTHLSIDLLPSSACVFRIEFDKTGYNSAAYGVFKKDLTSTGDGGVRAALVAAGLNTSNGSAEDKHWPWWRHLSPQDELMPFDKDWGLSAQPWAAIADGKMTSAIIATAHRFRDAIQSFGN